MTRAPAAIHAARLARDEARIGADLARLGPAASKDPAELGVAVDLLLARPRRLVVWECWRCGDDHETPEAPPRFGGRPYCAPCMDHVRDVEREAKPVTGAAAVAKVDALLADPKTVIVTAFNEPEPVPPVAREPIQADTPTPAPACPIGQVKLEPAAPATVAAEEGETTMAKVEEKAPPAKKPKARPCGCGLMGTHRLACKLAAKREPVKCEGCGKSFPNASALGPHRRSCKGKPGARGAAAAKRILELEPTPTPAAPPREPVEASTPRAEPEPPSLRCLVVRVRGAVPLEVECATPEDAAAFVRLVAVGASNGEARG